MDELDRILVMGQLALDFMREAAHARVQAGGMEYLDKILKAAADGIVQADHTAACEVNIYCKTNDERIVVMDLIAKYATDDPGGKCIDMEKTAKAAAKSGNKPVFEFTNGSCVNILLEKPLGTPRWGTK